MAMLAGPRKKQKVINLRAKNNEWSKDSNKFGQKMLEKMGWTPGKGLGANESGMVDHVIAKYKNDSGGLGFEDKNDQWTQHEDDFNAILKKLSQDEAPQDKLLSGVSLEQKSKSSKARVHYHKFTRGKDLSRYSEKDLANIFGKKSLKKKEKSNDLVVEEDAMDIAKPNQVFTTGGNMSDYFNKKTVKFNALKRNINEEDFNCAYKGFSGTSCENRDVDDPDNFSFKVFSTSNDQYEYEEKIKISKKYLEENSVKSKKKKRKVETCENNFLNENREADNPDNFSFKEFSTSNNQYEEERVKNSKEDLGEKRVKSKKENREVETCENNFSNDMEEETKVVHKKKKKNLEIGDFMEEHSIKKIKKKKNKSK